MKFLTRVTNAYLNNKEKIKVINENSKPSKELLEALRESKDIINCKIKSDRTLETINYEIINIIKFIFFHIFKYE